MQGFSILYPPRSGSVMRMHGHHSTERPLCSEA